MKWLINLLGKWTGAKAAWDKVNGYKSYLSGTALILTGIAGILNGLVGIGDIASLVEFAKHLSSDPSWLALLNGLAIVGLRHAKEK